MDGSRKVHGASRPVRETTQFEDVLVQHGILAEDKAVSAYRAAVAEARGRGEAEAASRVRTAGALAGLGRDAALARLVDAAQDENAVEDEEEALARIRERRVRELKLKTATERFGDVVALQRAEFMREVKDASASGGLGGAPMSVVLELFKPGLERSVSTSRALDEVAKAHPHVKFVRMVSDHCIENWPDGRVPAVFVYEGGALVGQLIGFVECGAGDARLLDAALRVLKVPLGRSAGGGRDEDEDDDDDEREARTRARIKVESKKPVGRLVDDEEEEDDE